MWIDNAEVVRRGQWTEVVTKWADTLVLDFDLWMLTRSLLERVDFSLEWRKVDSHVEEKLRINPKRKLQGNLLAWRLNEAADELAGLQRQKNEEVGEVFFQEAVVMVSYRGFLIHGSIHDVVTEGEHGPPLRQYLKEKFGWSEDTFQCIDWEAMKVYTRRLEGSKETNLIKLVMNWQNDNHQNEFFYAKDGVCPACQSIQEDHLHFISCRDPVLYRLNTECMNGVHRAMARTHTCGIISNAFREVLGALRDGREPREPRWRDDAEGQLGKEAWGEQRRIGWSNLAKGRLSKKWGRIQQRYYSAHPDYCHKKCCTGTVWAVRMIKELTNMLLNMWAHRCGCLHGHTKQDKKKRAKDMLGETIRKCYQRRGSVLIDHQDIFDQPVDILVSQRSLNYLRAWINMFHALVALSSRQLAGQQRLPSRAEEEDSVGTVETMDLDEYLVDATDGMDREWDIGDGEAVLTPPLVRDDICLGHSRESNNIGDLRNADLKKRKPPDGGG